MLRLIRILFSCCLFITFWVFISHYQSLNIDTSLTDLTPKIAENPDTKVAVDRLSANLEKRIIFLLEDRQEKTSSNQSEERIQLAKSEFINKLKSLANITVQAENIEYLNNIKDFFLPYRFQLLSPDQYQLIAQERSSDSELINDIAEQAYQDLFSLNSTPKLFSFKDDPLGWHSQTLASYFKDFLDTKNDNKGSELITLKLSERALSLKEQHDLNVHIKQNIQDIESKHQIKISRSGVFFFATESATQSKQEISLISSVSMIGILILLLSTFRNIGPVFLPFISIALGVCFAFALTLWFYGSIHILTIVFGASLIGVVIDYSLHYFYHKKCLAM